MCGLFLLIVVFRFRRLLVFIYVWRKFVGPLFLLRRKFYVWTQTFRAPLLCWRRKSTLWRNGMFGSTVFCMLGIKWLVCFNFELVCVKNNQMHRVLGAWWAHSFWGFGKKTDVAAATFGRSRFWPIIGGDSGIICGSENFMNQTIRHSDGASTVHYRRLCLTTLT